MLPASTRGGGMCFAFPDVCKVPAPPAPPVPTPFPNMAMCAAALAPTCSLTVKFANKPVLTIASEIPMSSGDEAGVAGGVVSGMIKGPVRYRRGVSTVLVEGKPVVTALSPTGQNGSNANAPAGAQVLPSQLKVFING